MLLLHEVRWLVLATQLWAAWSVLYLCLISAAVLLHGRKWNQDQAASSADWSVQDQAARTRFAILVPAHNEELLLGTLLDSLSQLNYPRDLYAVFVVADNCTDRTAALARAAGWVHVYERFDDTGRGKGYALSWLLARLEQDQLIFDAYVVLDADAVVNPGFLRSMDRELGNGARALQSCNTVLNVAESPGTALRWIALTLVNHVRPLGRNALGGSSTLTGTGVCLSRELLQRFPWRAYAVAEDYQYYLNLVEHGISARYVPDAVVRSEMPRTFANMRTQDIRWEAPVQGQSHWHTAWRLLVAGVRYRDWVRLEAVAELLTPPLSVLVSWSLLTLVASLLLRSLLNVAMSVALLVGLLVYVGTAVYVVRPSRAVCKALLYAPAFMAWKLWVYGVLSRSKKHSSEWIRTNRNV